MTTITSSDTSVQTPFDDPEFDEAQLAAASFLARYSGRTLEAYRQDLRGFFQWAADHDVPVLAATRPHIELWRGSMEERGLAASRIDRRLSTVCGFYRFAHIDGRIGSNPAEYVRRPQVHPSDARGLDRSELGMFLAAADHYDVAHRTCCAPRSSWPPSTPASRCETCRPPPGTPTPEPPRSTTGDGRTSTATPPTWSWHSSREADPRATAYADGRE